MHRPFGSSASFKIFLATLLLLICGRSAQAQIIEVKNQFVAGLVQAGTGIVSVKTVENGKSKDYVLNPDHSFLNLSINGTWYTNNMVGGKNFVGDIGGNGVQVTPIILDGWITNVVGKDTIRSVWTDKSKTFDIVQDVYPVQFRASGQVVIKVKIVNHTQSSISVEGLQWLNDLQAGSSDNPWLLERNYYDARRWRVPSGGNSNPNPPSFYMEFEHDPATLNLGVIGAGFTNDSFPPAPMGLTPCSAFAVVSWQGGAVGFQGLDYLYGCPASPTPPDAADLAAVLQWKPISVPAAQAGRDTTVEEFRTSFGTQEFCMCLGNAIAINVFPTHLQYDQKTRKYTPNAFNVLSMIFNVLSNSFTSATITHSVGSPLQIVGTKSGGSISANQLSSNYKGMTIPPGQMLNFFWSDSTLPNINCNGTGTHATMNFDMTASGYSGTWDCSKGVCDVLVDCADVDTIKPAHSTHIGVGPNGGAFRDTTFVVSDKLATDFGLKHIEWMKVGPDTSKLKVTVLPGLPTNCPKTDFTIEVRQMDSTKDGYVAFDLLDCAGNSSFDTVWFTAHFPPNPPDIYPPIFKNLSYNKQNAPINLNSGCTSLTNYQQSDWVVYDTFPQSHTPKFAHGLRSVQPIGSQLNMQFKANPSAAWPDSIIFHLSVIDTMKDGDICIEAIDSVTVPHPNRDTLCIHYCTVPDTNAPMIFVTPNGARARIVHVTDSLPWDRGIDSVFLYTATNVRGVPLNAYAVGCKDTFTFTVQQVDPNTGACFSIRAKDCYGNYFTSGVYCMGQDTDVHCPQINVTQTDFTHMHIVVSDTADSYEQGVDSVWFTGVANMKLTHIDPGGPAEAHCPGDPATTFNAIHGASTGLPRPSFQRVVSFDLEICDTSNININQACVTVYAMDGANHQACSSPYPYVWCVPITIDTLAPLLRDSNVSCSSVVFIAADNRINDRGLSHFVLSNAINLSPFDLNLQGSDLSSKTIALNVLAKGKSAYGELAAMDAFGAKQSDPKIQAAHSASGKFWLYAQDLVMKAGHVFLDAGDYDVKILLDKNDLIKSLAQKNIWQAEFSFHLDGDTSDIRFVTAKPGAFAPNWTVTTTQTSAGHYTVTATGAPLPDMTANDDVLLTLTFHANSTPNTSATRIVLDPVACGSESYAITYNGGADTGVAFTNATMTMHAPFGNMNGGVLTIKGNCTPFASTNGALPTAISMSPVQPNPAWKGTPSLHVMYTLADEGAVRMNLFNSLGEKVRSVLSESQKQGEYQLDIPSSDLPEGMYFLRLEAGGLMITRRVVLGGE